MIHSSECILQVRIVTWILVAILGCRPSDITALQLDSLIAIKALANCSRSRFWWKSELLVSVARTAGGKGSRQLAETVTLHLSISSASPPRG